MKQLIVFALALFFISCDTTDNPKNVSKEFVSSLYSLDYEKASSLATAETRDVIMKKDVAPLNTERKVTEVKNMFLLDSLNEKVVGESAQVENDVLLVTLQKENNEWKVVATQALIDNIINRTERVNALQVKWNALQQAYENRRKNAQNYLQYLKQKNSLSADASALDKALDAAVLKEGFTKNDLQQYIQKQQEISTLLQNVLQPSANASADMSTNYIIQINLAESTIEGAKKEYNELAQSVKSNVFVPVQ